MSRETVGLFSRFRNGLDMRIKRESPPDPKDRHIVPTGFNLGYMTLSSVWK